MEAELRGLSAAHVGMEPDAFGASASGSTRGLRRQRGEVELRDALVDAALAQPSQILQLHPQIVALTTSPLPTRRAHPLLVLLFVRLPASVLGALLALFSVAYGGAYLFFNDEVLGRFISTRVSGLLDGDLELGSVHWRPRLILDLVTGTPSPITVRDVRVWEPYKRDGLARERTAVEAELLETRLVLHDIIPWNRLGIPSVFDIPWILHFTDVQVDAPARFDIRGYRQTAPDGEVRELIGLIGAFLVTADMTGAPKGLGFVVEQASFADVALDLDLRETADWRLTLPLRDVRFELASTGRDFSKFERGPIPFRFDVAGRAPEGTLQVRDIELPLANVDLREFRSGTGPVRRADLGFDIAFDAAGSPARLRGQMTDALGRLEGDPPPTWIAADLASPDAHRLLRNLVPQLGGPPGGITGRGRALLVHVEGPLARPDIVVAADGINLDLFGDAALGLVDVDAQVRLRSQPVPPTLIGPDTAPGEHWVATFERLTAFGVNGKIALQDDPGPGGMIVLPAAEGEPTAMQFDVAVDGIDPALLVANDRELAQRIGGSASGRIELSALRLWSVPAADPAAAAAPTTTEVALDLRVDRLRLTRRRGPADDGLPRQLRLDGQLARARSGALDARGLTLAVDGGRIAATGGFDPASGVIAETSTAVEVDDGPAVLAAFGIDPWIDRLEAALVVRGPWMAPSGEVGRLSVSGFGPTSLGGARIWFDAGTLKLRAADGTVLGGRGDLELDLTLFAGGKLLPAPRLRGQVAIDGLDASALSPSLAGRIDVRAEIGGAQGESQPLASLEVRGSVAADTLRIGETVLRGIEAKLVASPTGVVIEYLRVPVHRAVSPKHAPGLTVPIGEFVVEGHVDPTAQGYADPALDLQVRADGLPLPLLTTLLGLDVPLRGKIGEGTRLTVGGTLRRPALDGTIRLAGLRVQGVALGSGELRLTADDVPEAGMLQAHREIVVRGEFRDSSAGPAGDGLSWRADGIIALGLGAVAPRRASAADTAPLPPIEAEVRVELDRVTLAALRGDVDADDPLARVDLGATGVSASVVLCADHDPRGAAVSQGPMISPCVSAAPLATAAGRADDAPPGPPGLSVDLDVARAWWRPAKRDRSGVDPCKAADALCSTSPLRARLTWPTLELVEPWVLASRGPLPAELTLSGSFDLSPPPATTAPAEVPPGCMPAIGPALAVAGRGRARVEGALDLAVLRPLIPLDEAGAPLLRELVGRIDVYAGLEGHASALVPSGTLAGELEFGVAAGERVIPIEIPTIDADIGGEAVFVAATLRAAGKRLTIGDAIAVDAAPGATSTTAASGGESGVIRRPRGYFAYRGTCSGAARIDLAGEVPGSLLQEFVGPPIIAASGSVQLDPLTVALRPSPAGYTLERLEGALRFGATALRAELSSGVPSVELVEGLIEFARCGERGRCRAGAPDDFAVWIGGRRAARSASPPSTALRAKLGERGRGSAWGEFVVRPGDLTVRDTDVHVVMSDVPLRTYDARGGPELEAELAAEDLRITGGAPLRVAGSVGVAQSRWLKDAVSGVDILNFTDSGDAISAPPPAALAGMQLDLDVQTNDPLRIDNNIVDGMEARLLVKVGGTYEAPELAGRIDLEPGGSVKIPFVSGNFEIQRGRINIDRDLSSAPVDVLTLRREPVYIDRQPRRIELLLGGTLASVTWACATGGQRGGELDTARGCFDFLVFGAGDLDLSDADVQRAGGGALLSARKPLQVVSNVAEFDVGARIDEATARVTPPDVKVRLGQIGPELEIATPRAWFDFGYGFATVGWQYTRGYPGSLLQQDRELNVQIRVLDDITLEYRLDRRTYLNERIIFDPLRQQTFELRFDYQVPSLR
jgi:hypothetical protein